MKKTLLSLVLLLSAVCMFAENLTAYMFQPEGSLYTENEKGELVWAASLFAGAELEVLTKEVNGKLVPDEKDTKRIVNKKLTDCHVYHVLYNEKTYYVVSDRISIQDDFAVISAETAIYRSPDLADVLDSTLAIGTFITFDSDKVYYPIGTKITEESKSFKKIYYYNPVAYTVECCYVKSANMETQRDDLKALQVLAKLKTIKDKAVKEELLNNIKNLNNSKGLAYLIELENKALNPVQETAAKETTAKETTESKVNTQGKTESKDKSKEEPKKETKPQSTSVTSKKTQSTTIDAK